MQKKGYKLRIETANEKLNDGKAYTTATIAVLNIALEKANELANGEKLLVGSQETITKAAEDLENATTNLKEKADYTAFDEAISAYDALVKENYITDSLTTATDAYNVAKAVDRDLDITQQTTIDNATTALNTAINSLELKPADYTAYTAKFNELNSFTNNGTYEETAFTEFKNKYVDLLDTRI